jgi:hypothetical protein
MRIAWSGPSTTIVADRYSYAPTCQRRFRATTEPQRLHEGMKDVQQHPLQAICEEKTG